jgi:hypothetical protein
LGQAWQFSGLTNKEVKDLAPADTYEICSLGILAGLGSETNWQVGYGWNLLDVAGSPFYGLSVDCVSWGIDTAIQEGVSEIEEGAVGVDPIYHEVVAVAGWWAGFGVISQKVGIAEGRMARIVNISRVGNDHTEVSNTI